MRPTLHRLIALPLGAALLLALSGCEDPQARQDAQSAGKELGNLRSEVAKLSAKNDEMARQITELRAALAQESEKRGQMIDDKIFAASKDLQDKVAAAAESISKTTGQLREMGANVEKMNEGNVNKNSLELRLKAMKEEVEKSHDDLKKFMDNQLRELYPYAYQPKRMDPNAPPPAPEPEKKTEN